MRKIYLNGCHNQITIIKINFPGVVYALECRLSQRFRFFFSEGVRGGKQAASAF